MSTSDLAVLRDAVRGDVIEPGDGAWDAARQAWNLAVDQRPAAVVRAAGPQDVAATVRFAGSHGLRVAPQSTGHGAPSLGDLSGAILLRTGALDAVSVDPATRTARVGAGASSGALIAAATPHGLTSLHGYSPVVGVAGYTLGGGIGWFCRSHGLAAHRVRALDVVTADGQELRVDAGSEPDLFWALRGGGGAGAIVTALELELHELRTAFGGSLMWPIAHAADVVHGYRTWIGTLPDTVTTNVKLVRFPPLPELPEPLRGRAFATVTLVATGDDAAAAELVAPLRAIAGLEIDTLGPVPAAALADIAGDPPGPLPGIGDGFLLDDLTAEAADAYLDLAGPGVDVPLIQLEIRQLGGALRRPPADGGAAGGIEAGALVYGVGLPATPELATAIGATLQAVAERLAPWHAGTTLTFAERQRGTRPSLHPAAADRLAAVVAAYDPDGLVLANHVPD